MKRFLLGAALGTMLVMPPAFAQSTMPSNTNPGTANSPTTTAPGASRPATEASRNNSGNVAPTMAATDVMASRLIGSSIRNSANESIGDINDLVIDSSGKVKSVIAGVGGFLGIGEQNVELSFDQLHLTKDTNGNSYLQSSMSRDQLRALPKWTDQNSSSSSRAR